MCLEDKTPDTRHEEKLQLYGELFGFLAMLNVLASPAPVGFLQIEKDVLSDPKGSDMPMDILAQEYPYLYALYTAF